MDAHLSRWLALGALLGAWSSMGCSSTSTCSRDADAIDVYSGFVNADKTIYESSIPNEQELVYFPPNRTLKFHFGPPSDCVATPTQACPPPPGLANVPSVFIYLSFSPDAGSTLATSAGNAGLIRVTTADRVEIHNDTCSDYYVWLYATTSATPFEPVSMPAAGTGGASGEAAPSHEAGAAGSL